MPYKDISELPSSVKDHLPPDAQRQFMEVCNSVLKAGGSEEKAFTEAWGVIGKRFEKGADGMWKAMKHAEHVFIFTNSGEITLSKHDAILQTLNRWIGSYFMNSDAFNPPAWDGLPIIYQKEGVHPDLVSFSTNPEAELKRINGRQVGIAQSPVIDVNGHARLTSQLVINDTHVDGLINSKKISLSTGFFGKYDESNKLTATTPNHILLFEEGSGNSAVPVDIGAIILNSMDKGTMDKMYSAMDAGGKKEYMKSMLKDLSDHPEMMDEEMKGMMSNLKVIKNSIMKEIEDKMAEDKTITEAEKQVQILNSQLEVKAKETAALEARIKEFEAEKLVQIKNTREGQWKQIKNSLPPGITATPELESRNREQFVTDPWAYTVFVASQIKPVETKAEGVEHPILNSDGKPAREDQKVTVGGAHMIGV